MMQEGKLANRSVMKCGFLFCEHLIKYVSAKSRMMRLV